METTHGTWGNRIKTFQWDGGLVTILYLEPNKRCSWHSHMAQFNQFFCIKGKLGIKTDKGYITWLNPKQSFTVEPNVIHEFQTGDDGALVQEIAYVKYNEYDIVRLKLGGEIIEASKLKATKKETS